MLALKTCSKCGETKPLDAFYRRKRAKDGRNGECAACVKAAVRAWQKANPDKAAEGRRRWQKQNREKISAIARERRKQNPAATREINRRYRERNPKKARARDVLANEVAKGGEGSDHQAETLRSLR